jgi:hypothetical protein
LPHGRHQVRRRRKRVLSFENARRNLWTNCTFLIHFDSMNVFWEGVFPCQRVSYQFNCSKCFRVCLLKVENQRQKFSFFKTFKWKVMPIK